MKRFLFTLTFITIALAHSAFSQGAWENYLRVYPSAPGKQTLYECRPFAEYVVKKMRQAGFEAFTVTYLTKPASYNGDPHERMIMHSIPAEKPRPRSANGLNLHMVPIFFSPGKGMFGQPTGTDIWCSDNMRFSRPKWIGTVKPGQTLTDDLLTTFISETFDPYCNGVVLRR